ncbi:MULTISPECIES: RidA family protein [unclassified Mesorhizobium]|jgi:enamine deaminase RidA (YjgF/YER057c/UK114 family)|uniref:RidA family protein n=1 Tax=unclassified Mesorhizobium TaxID=325217 RepID=UPI0008EE95F3|nr:MULTISPECIES: RidA family protein [unclassified Mesorhizobium]RJG45361.1 RidA family protein [Mesorhizobium sp. DCY119]SFU14794.1 Enamine deaminase RidA, house cleaning of reactive enamine intermediates, YjgF/YER057c/UK114 family [Mesorhizobium sp. YR577]
MGETIENRLKDLGVYLPQAAAPAANYVPFMQSGKLVFTAGQLPLKDGKLVASGLLGRDLDTAAGKEAAKLCAINILAQAKAAVGDLDKIKRLVKITVFVASSPDFTEQHLVANGASDFLVAALGDAGKHARSAVGVAVLPLNAAVEIEAIIEVA